MNNIRYFYCVDFLRWIAALGILIHHYTAYFLYGSLTLSSEVVSKYNIENSKMMTFIIDNAILGSYGVWFFWMISGFIFSHTIPANSSRRLFGILLYVGFKKTAPFSR